MKIIEVETCESCSYIHHDDGGGHCSSFIICNKYNIMLYDWDGPEDFDYMHKIHPDCKLKEKMKK